MSASPAGRVWAHVGQPFAPRSYDVLVLGAGRMGSTCAHFLRRLAPHLSVLLLDEGGLPNEDGATLLAAGVWRTDTLPADRHAEAGWVREQLAGGFGDLRFRPRPLLSFGSGETDAGSAALLRAEPGAWALVEAGVLDPAHLGQGKRSEAATYRPGLLALHAAQAAVRAGADLMLNTRATLTPGGARLERLTVTNTHAIVTHETHLLTAGATVVALGAAGPEAAEHDLGLHTTHARAYRQSPRLNVPTGADTPLLEVGGLLLRPQNGALTLHPPIHHRDPHGYVPEGGRLTGVPTGLRRETLEDLVSRMDAVPALATPALDLGRSLGDVPGSWLALPGGDPAGLPLHRELAPGLHLLLGGPQADTLGLSTAYDLAATLAAQQGRPWNKG